MKVEIMGISYLLVKIPVVNEKSQKLAMDMAKQCECLFQSLERHSGGIWGTTYMNIVVYCPEHNMRKLTDYNT